MASRDRKAAPPRSWREPGRVVVQEPPEESRPDKPVPVLERVVEWLGDRCLSNHQEHGDATVVVAPPHLVELMEFVRTDPDLAMDILMDMTGVDGLGFGYRNRFRVVYHLFSTTKNHRLRVKVVVPEGDPVVPTLTGLWACANWFEREVWDMFGIRFEGHPDLRRILMYEEFQGHPLRKDYPLKKRQPLIGPNPASSPWRVANWPPGVGSGPGKALVSDAPPRGKDPKGRG